MDPFLLSSSESESSSIWSFKSKACAKAPGISPTSLSLNEGLALGLVAWLPSGGKEARDPPLNSAWLMSFTFLLLRASSASSSLESVHGCMTLITFMSYITHYIKLHLMYTIHNLIIFIFIKLTCTFLNMSTDKVFYG